MTKLDELNMSKNHVFKNDEELNNALNEVSEAYSKPPTNSDYVFVGILLVLLPIAGIIGYIYDWSWLFYIVGGLITLMEIIFLFTGALRCLGSVLLNYFLWSWLFYNTVCCHRFALRLMCYSFIVKHRFGYTYLLHRILNNN